MCRIKQWFKKLRRQPEIGVPRGRFSTRDGKPLAGDKVMQEVDFGAGQTMATGDFVLSAGFGSTSTIDQLRGRDSAFSFRVACSGTGQGSNPTITITMNTGVWGGTVPVCICAREDAVSPAGGVTWTVSQTSNVATLTITFIGTPVASSNYKFSVLAVHP